MAGRAVILLLLMGLLLHAGSDSNEQVRVIQSEVLRLRYSRAPLALSKGEEALRLLAASPNPALELQIRMEMIRILMDLGKAPEAGRSLVRAQALAEKVGDRASQRRVGALRAKLFNLEGKITEAVQTGKAVLQEAEDARDAYVLADVLGTLGLCAATSGNFPQGIQDLYRAQEYAEASKDLGLKQGIRSLLSTFYIRTQEWEKALKANRDSWALARELDDPNRMANLSLNASAIAEKLNRPDDEFQMLMEAEALGQKAGNQRVLMIVKVNLSDILLKRKDYRRALKEAEDGWNLTLQLGDRVSGAVALTNCGVALNHLGKHAQGLEMLETALEEHRASGAAGHEVELLGILSEEYAFAKNFQKALEYHQVFKEKSDKLYFDSRAKTVQELEARYQSEKRERQITQLKAEGERRRLVLGFSLLGGVLSLSLAAALLGRYRQLQRSSAQLENLNDQLEALSVTDPLTGLRNRRYLVQHIATDTARADRAHQASLGSPERGENCDLTFFLIDLDHFKHVNDTYGHHAGDLVLQQVAARLQAAKRDSDDLVRWGGEEFLLVARETRRELAPTLAERLRNVIEATPFDLGDGQTLGRTCSIGFAPYPLVSGSPGNPGWETVVDLADQALYAAKSSGRNGWVGLCGLVPPALGSESSQVLPLRGLIQNGRCQVQCSFGNPESLSWGG